MRSTLRCCTSVLLCLLSSALLRAQNWKQPMTDPSVSFYQIQQDFRHDMRWKERELERERQEEARRQSSVQKTGTTTTEEDEEEAEGYLQYKRWEDYMAPRVYPSGDLTLPSTNWDRFQDYLNNNADANYQYQRSQPGGNAMRQSGPTFTMASNWTFAGPTGAPTGGGAGRVGFVRVDPTNSNNVWVGAPAGGLWKSTNGGTSWTTNTDFLTVIGASDVAIDPTNTQTMYLATGDGDAGDTYSIGVMKSTDGGATWNTTGLTWTVNQGRVIRKLLINPTNTQIIMAFSNAGIWRTTNGGTNWTQVLTNNCTDGEFQPGTPNTVYACGTSFFKSTDGGATWTTITSGTPTAANVDRLAIAVTAANSAYVYMLAGSAANDGFYGFYKSTNNGTSFTQVTVSSPSNMLGWASAGNDSGGQGWYDLSLDASPTNANEVLAGGVNIWRTTNGGTSWTLNAHWTGSGAPYVHADIHHISYANGTTVWVGCDGGVFKTTNNGTNWSDMSNNLCIAQSYRIGLSASNASLWITGHQDNGTNLKNGASYGQTMGGDGMDCFIDRTNNNVMYGEQYSGSLNRSTNGGGSWSAITSGLTGTAPWVTPWYQDPTTANTIYCGRSNIWKSTNQGTSWTMLAALPGSGTIVDFKVAPSNNQVIYVVRSNAAYKTTNGGTSWTTITGTLPVGSAAISRVDVKPNDPLVAIVTFSGYSSGNKAFKTTNGGTSWTNISTGLPNLPVNCVRFDPGNAATEAVYVGCDVGVYYMDNTFTSWQPYFTSLPNVPVFDLEVYSPTGKLRASTYGRGVWEVDIYNPGTLPPVALFAPSTLITCVGNAVNFTDQSSFNPTSWSWTFPSGTPASATTQNVNGVIWNTPGTYTVTLTCSNANGSSSATQVVTVLGSVAPPLVEGFEAAQFLPTGWTAKNINNDGIYWAQASVGATSTKSATFDNYNNDVAGAQDEMWAPRLNCSSFSTLSMTFDVAYAPYDLVTYTDTLQVLVSTDCGATWTSVYLKGGSTLATAAAQTASMFSPTAAQWRNESVTLNAYAGQSSVLIVFRNRGHYGQAMYVDNINITGTTATIPSATFTASTTTVCAGSPVNFTDNSTNNPTSWSWTFPSGTPASATTQNVTGVVWNTAGTYTVTHTATNASGTGTQTLTVTVTALPTVTTTATSTSICSGNSTTLTASGATSYTWMPGNLTGASVSVTPTTTTTYTVTGTNAAGCTNTATRTITVNPTPTVTATASSATICSGNSTTLTATGGTTYTWNPGALTGTSVTVSPTTTTTYTVTGTTGGCSSTATQLVTVNPTPTVTTTASSTTICAGSNTTLTASGATTYTWNPGALTGTSVTVSPTTTTTYTVSGTSTGCTGTATRTITVNPSPTVTTTATSTTICSGNSTTITGSGATSYTWNPGALTGTSVTVSPATTTTYTVTGTGANGCTNTATRTITVNPTPTVTTTASSTTICSGSSTTLTATGATTYTWNPGALTGTSVTVSPTSTTTYTVTGTSTGCTGTATRTITVNPSPTVTTTTSGGTICAGSSTTLTASGAVSYSWTPGPLSGATITVSPATTTTYTVTGTGANGCTRTATRTITVNPSPTVTATASSTSICTGNSVTLTGSGANTYAWNPGALSGTSVTVTPGATTTYTVTGTAANGCTNTNTLTITVGSQPTVTASTTSSTICSGNSTTLTGGGATTYTWNPGALSGTTVSVSPTTTTTYTVTGTVAAGCSNTATVLVTVNASPTVTTTTSGATICSGNNTTITGSGATSYTWNPGALTGTTVSVSPVATTTYTVTGTAANGCTNTATRTITVNPSPTVTLTTSGATICSGNSTTMTAAGATSYSWMPGALTGTTVSVAPAVTTTYTVTGTGANSCSGTQTLTITVNPIPTVTATASGSSVCAGNSVTLTGNGATNYSWMPGSLSGSSVSDTPAASTTYTMTGTDVNGCSSTATVAVAVNALPTVTAGSSAPSVCAGSPVTLSGNGATTYSWQPISQSGASVTDSPATATTYTVTGTDANGCSGSATVAVAVNALPTVTAAASNSGICSGNTVTLTGNGATTYTWMPGSLSGSPATDTPAATTTYTVTGTDANGCSDVDTVTVAVNALPNVSISGTSGICPGDNVTLTGNGATSYAWQPGGQTTVSITDAPAASTTYSVTGTDANGCTATSTFAVTVFATPATPNVIVNGSTLTSSVTGSSYQWYLNGVPITGATSQSYTATQNGSYTVEVYSGNGCVSGQSSPVIDPTGIAMAGNGVNSVSLFPNPNDGHFLLTFEVEKTDDYVLEIYDAIGQVVYRESLKGFSGNYNKEIDLSNFSRGLYTIRLRSTHTETVLKTLTY